MNVEAAIVAHLKAGGFAAYADVPKPRPSEFVTVERTGGPERYGIDRPTVAVQAWAQTRYEASELMKRVDDRMKGLVELQDVAKCTRNSMYNYPDENQARYQAVYDLVVY